MGWRGTVVLALLVLVAGAALWFSPQAPEPLSDSTLLGEPRFVKPDADVAKLVEFDPAEVEKITLGFHDEVVTVARDGDRWRGAADDRNLGDFLDALAATSVISTIDEQRNLADFGLDAPTRRILLDRRNGEPVVVLMGERNPAVTAVYVRLGDGPVSIAGALLVWEFDKAFAAITGRKPSM